jgi:hypothetical protein
MSDKDLCAHTAATLPPLSLQMQATLLAATIQSIYGVEVFTALCTGILLMLQEHPLLAWPLFIFLLILTFYLYSEDFACIHIHYLFWLVVLPPYLFWLYSL